MYLRRNQKNTMKNCFRTMFVLLIVIFNSQFLHAQNSEDALSIIPNGNVGIGTTSPKEKLEVNGRIKDKTGFVMPVGTIVSFAGNKAPEGWLLCNGESFPTTGSTEDLFAVIGYTYGGNGNKFKVPDLRQTFVMGATATYKNEVVGKTGNPDTHTHNVNPPGKSFDTNEKGSHSHEPPDPCPQSARKTLSSDGVAMEDSGEHHHSVTVDIPEFESGESSGKNRPQWMALNYIIKY